MLYIVLLLPAICTANSTQSAFQPSVVIFSRISTSDIQVRRKITRARCRSAVSGGTRTSSQGLRAIISGRFLLTYSSSLVVAPVSANSLTIRFASVAVKSGIVASRIAAASSDCCMIKSGNCMSVGLCDCCAKAMISFIVTGCSRLLMFCLQPTKKADQPY